MTERKRHVPADRTMITNSNVIIDSCDQLFISERSPGGGRKVRPDSMMTTIKNGIEHIHSMEMKMGIVSFGRRVGMSCHVMWSCRLSRPAPRSSCAAFISICVLCVYGLVSNSAPNERLDGRCAARNAKRSLPFPLPPPSGHFSIT